MGTSTSLLGIEFDSRPLTVDRCSGLRELHTLMGKAGAFCERNLIPSEYASYSLLLT